MPKMPKIKKKVLEVLAILTVLEVENNLVYDNMSFQFITHNL